MAEDLTDKRQQLGSTKPSMWRWFYPTNCYSSPFTFTVLTFVGDSLRKRKFAYRGNDLALIIPIRYYKGKIRRKPPRFFFCLWRAPELDKSLQLSKLKILLAQSTSKKIRPVVPQMLDEENNIYEICLTQTRVNSSHGALDFCHRSNILYSPPMINALLLEANQYRHASSYSSVLQLQQQPQH